MNCSDGFILQGVVQCTQRRSGDECSNFWLACVRKRWGGRVRIFCQMQSSPSEIKTFCPHFLVIKSCSALDSQPVTSGTLSRPYVTGPSPSLPPSLLLLRPARVVRGETGGGAGSHASRTLSWGEGESEFTLVLPEFLPELTMKTIPSLRI